MIRSESAEITYRASGPAPLRCEFLESGIYDGQRENHFDHPTPPFNRVFLFQRGGCQLCVGSRRIQLEARTIHLLPTQLSFDVTYRAGSLMYFFHLHLRDASGVDVFSQCGEILSLHDAALYRRVIEGYNQRETRNDAWQLALFESATRAGEPHIAARQRITHDPRVANLLDEIRNSASAGTTVASLARRAHMSPAALSKAFRRATGVSLKHHLLDAILLKAQRRLSDSDDTVREIAFALGFEDPFYFCRLFKKKLGQTALQYRRAVQAQRRAMA